MSSSAQHVGIRIVASWLWLALIAATLASRCGAQESSAASSAETTAAPGAQTAPSLAPVGPPATGGWLSGLLQPARFRSERASSANPDLSKNGDARGIDPGATLVIADLEGPGIITHIWNTLGTADPLAGRNLVLRCYWDDHDQPSVQAPLGDFFGVGHGAEADFASLPVAVSSFGRARSCYWPMPFRKRARVTVTNESALRVDSFYWYVDWQRHESLADDVPYFHAEYRQAMPAEPGDYTILEARGRGHYVGTVYSAHQVKLGWFGEGDDRFYIDGEEYPSLSGTGTEDYFGDAWGFRQFATPHFGVSLWEGYFPGDRVTAYRWHLADPVAFRESLRVTIEHRGSIFTDLGVEQGSFVERPDWLSSVAYWYQTPVAGCTFTLPPAADRLAPYRVFSPEQLTIRAKPALGLVKQAEGVVYIPGRDDAQIEIDFEVEEKGRYQINATLLHSVFGGVYQPLLDGKPIGEPLDLCQQGFDPLWVRLDLHDLRPGTHTISFEGRGTSPQLRSKAPRMHAFGLRALVLLRLEDMAGYK